MRDLNKIEWKEWWRNVEGAVSLDNGFHYVYRNPDYWFFDIDPEDSWQEQIDEENDPRYVHQDELFDNREDAVEAAKEWCREAEDDLIAKKVALGIYKFRCDECDAELDDDY